MTEINFFTTDGVHIGKRYDNGTFKWQLGTSLGDTVQEIKNCLNRKHCCRTQNGDTWKMKEFWKMLDEITEQETETKEFL